MGAKNKDNSSIRLNLYYISVPVMLQYNILPVSYLEAGPQLSFAINKKIRNDNRSVDATRHYNGFDFEPWLGAGYCFEQGSGVTARYIAGLTNIIENGQGNDMRNNFSRLESRINFKVNSYPLKPGFYRNPGFDSI
ncbi:PorT family protein [Chryseobacterium hagamense]|uniref:Outer membrane protein beta-barrel domain-containing protein n=1 Tax=Chryseobacterium hagamense TaxID=395935 RepID=A0A511YH88_9FLAO|nr:PorT family protein [Chryseobacterium hagamense]GEN74526.1 hypothetical protein CHA01nite_02660 [Chryseobacterium hagamense]